MTETLTREQVEQCRRQVKLLVEDNANGDGQIKMKLTEWLQRVDSLCDMALSWLDVQPPPSHEPGDITLNTEQIKFVTRCERVAEQRGRAAGLAQAVKWHEDWRVYYCDKIVQAERVNNAVMTRRYYKAMKQHEEAAEAIRGFSPSPPEYVLVPREPTPAMIEAGVKTPWAGYDTVANIYRAMIAKG